MIVTRDHHDAAGRGNHASRGRVQLLRSVTRSGRVHDRARDPMHSHAGVSKRVQAPTCVLPDTPLSAALALASSMPDATLSTPTTWPAVDAHRRGGSRAFHFRGAGDQAVVESATVRTHRLARCGRRGMGGTRCVPLEVYFRGKGGGACPEYGGRACYMLMSNM